MATWTDIAAEAMNAAKLLLDRSNHRGAVNRAYYAAYSAVTAELAKTSAVKGPAGRSNPSHEQVARLAQHNLNPERFSDADRREVSKRLRVLRMNGVDADYKPGQTVDRPTALMCVRDASAVFERLSQEASCWSP